MFDKTVSSVASLASGHVGTCPLELVKKIFSLYVETSCLVCFGTMPNSNSALFVQPYSLWNDTVSGYNGACAKVNVVFTARRYAIARSLLTSGVRPSVCPSRSCIVSRRLKISSDIFLGR